MIFSSSVGFSIENERIAAFSTATPFTYVTHTSSPFFLVIFASMADAEALGAVGAADVDGAASGAAPSPGVGFEHARTKAQTSNGVRMRLPYQTVSPPCSALGTRYPTTTSTIPTTAKPSGEVVPDLEPPKMKPCFYLGILATYDMAKVVPARDRYQAGSYRFRVRTSGH
jgi:hypothetical protein